MVLGLKPRASCLLGTDSINTVAAAPAVTSPLLGTCLESLKAVGPQPQMLRVTLTLLQFQALARLFWHWALSGTTMQLQQVSFIFTFDPGVSEGKGICRLHPWEVGAKQPRSVVGKQEQLSLSLGS